MAIVEAECRIDGEKADAHDEAAHQTLADLAGVKVVRLRQRDEGAEKHPGDEQHVQQQLNDRSPVEVVVEDLDHAVVRTGKARPILSRCNADEDTGGQKS